MTEYLPTGTTRYNPVKAYSSYELFTGGDNIAYLIDLNCNSAHEWQDAGGFSRGKATANNQLYRAQPVPYAWVPAGIPHSERAITAVDISQLRLAPLQ